MFPHVYMIEGVAQRWHVPPWIFDTDDPVISRWLQLGLLLEDFERQARPKHTR
jgi:hypothetical protein